MKRMAVLFLALLLACFVLPLTMTAQQGKNKKLDSPPLKKSKPVPKTDTVPQVTIEKAIRQALDLLESDQNPRGFWESTNRTKRIDFTAIALLAYFTNGYTTNEGPYRQTIRRGLDWLMQNVNKRNDPRRRIPGPGSEAYAKQFYVVTLAMAMGTDKTEKALRVKWLEEHLALVLEAQRKFTGKSEKLTEDQLAKKGGWNSLIASTYYTFALVLLKESGFDIPDSVFADLIGYFKIHFSPITNSFYERGAWAIDRSTETHLAWTPPVLVALMLLKEEDSKEAQNGLRRVVKEHVEQKKWWRGCGKGMRWYSQGRGFCYAWAYAALAMYGRGRGEELYQIGVKRLLALKLDSGSYKFPGENWGIILIRGEKYPDPVWLGYVLGYGGDWTESHLAARTAVFFGMKKYYLPFLARPLRHEWTYKDRLE